MNCFYLFMSLLFFANLNSAEATPPQWKYQTLRTQHFEIIYREEQKEIAKIYAKASEDAYNLLAKVFSEAPKRTIVVLKDDTDFANGSATFLPYPMISINLTLPKTTESISDYGDWAFEIMLHEYTHILNMFPVHGLMVPLKYLFGNIIRPNALLPRWYLEGLAVHTESRLSQFGRLRSPDSSARIRAAHEGKLLEAETIDRINESGIPTWPYGDRPYLFGAAWWNSAYKDSQVPQDLNQSYSRRIPFFINGPLESRLKQDASQILEGAYTKISIAAAAQLKAIDQAGGEKIQAMEGETHAQLSNPTISPNGLHLAYLGSNYKDAGSIRVVSRASVEGRFELKNAETIERTIGTTRLTWLPDSSGLIFDSVDISRPHVTYSDLFLKKLNSPTNLWSSSQRLSFNLRASQPTLADSGNEIYFIHIQNMRQTLAVMDIKTLKSKILFKAGYQERLSHPTFLGTKVYFIRRTIDGKDLLQGYDTEKNRINSIPIKLNTLNFLAKAGDQLLVGSSQTGSTNIYSWNSQDGKTQALTNIKTEISSATLDTKSNELIVSRLTSKGHKLYRGLASPKSPPALQPIYEVGAAPVRSDSPVESEELSYQPLRYMLPSFWLPFIYPVEGGVLFQGLTYSADPLERNQYTLAGSYDTVTQKGGYAGSYLNRSTKLDLGLSYAKFQSYLGASDVTLENQSAEVDLGFYLSSRNKFWRGNLSGSWEQTVATEHLKRLGPGARIEYNRLQSPFRSWGWAMGLGHQEYLQQDGYFNYGVSNARLALRTGTGSANSQHLFLDLKGVLAPRMPFGEVVTLGERSLGANYIVNLSGSSYLLRGYPSGTFVGRKLVNANLEYQFPLLGVWSGSGTLPIFFQNIEGVLFFDTMAVDGRAFHGDSDPNLTGYYRSRLSEFYSGTGMEFRLNTTAGYHLPLIFTLGLYYGLKEEYSGGFTTFFGIGYQGLSAIDR